MIESLTCLCLVLADPQFLSAQPTNRLTFSVAYERVVDEPYDRTAKQPFHRRMTLPQELIFRRAAFRARQRVARIESRKWLERSLLRPRRPRAVAPADWYPYAGRPWNGNQTYVWVR